MLKELPKLLDRDFLIGFFLPGALFAAAAVWILIPIPEVRNLIKQLATDPISGFVICFIVVGILAVHLAIANRAITRFFEGYYFPKNRLWFPEWWQLRRRNSRLEKLSDLERRWDAIEDNPRQLRQARDKRNRLLRELATLFPDDDRYVLPTGFGNVIRAFEVYPGRMYGIDAIPAWPRIMILIPEELSKQIGAAKSAVDYFLNVCLLSMILCCFKLYRIWWAYQTDMSHSWIGYILDNRSRYIPLILLLLLAILAYRAACYAAIGWGNTVKSTFDLYIDELAKRLGYEPPLPVEVWREITQSFLYLDPLPPRPTGTPRPTPGHDGFTC